MKWQINECHHNMEIRDFLKDIHSFSKRLIISIKFEGGRITVNGKQETVRYHLQTNDILSIQFPPEKIGDNLRAEDLPLSILYEDDDVMIINKPAYIAVMPSAQHKTDTIANRILAYYAKENIPYTVHIVTRLDRDTSGLLLVAKHSYSHSLLAKAQQKGMVKRKYKAIVEGYLRNKQGTIAAPIGRKDESIIERTVTETGQNAITRYKVRDEFLKHSLIDIELETGRTHQIRVHFSHINHPLAGDDLYGGSLGRMRRQALHCDELSFEQPLTKEKISYHLPIPDDMRRFMIE